MHKSKHKNQKARNKFLQKLYMTSLHTPRHTHTHTHIHITGKNFKRGAIYHARDLEDYFKDSTFSQMELKNQ